MLARAAWVMAAAVTAVMPACGTDVVDAPPVTPTRILPGVSAKDGGSLAGYGTPDIWQRPCLIRYEFGGNAWWAPDADCPVVLVGGDPRHFKIECPPNHYLQPEHEIQIDADGHVIYEWYTGWPTGHTPAPWWDAPGYTITSVDAAGMPLRADLHREFINPGTGLPIPGAADQVVRWTWDSHQRMTLNEATLSIEARPWSSFDVTYDDVAGRISYGSSYDRSALVPLSLGLPDHLGGYDQFDENGRIIERHWGDDETYAYDEQGRMVTHTYTATGAVWQYVEHRIYECP